jgi:Na+-driven multidrug efflux pump
VLWYLSRHVLPLRLRDFCVGGTRGTVGSLLRIGSANGAGKAAEAAAFTGLGGLAGALGTESMASYAIFYSFVSIVYMYMIGFTNATARSLVPVALGEEPRFDLLRACLVVFAGVAMVVMALGMADARLIWIWSAPGQQVSPLLTQVTLPAVVTALSFAAVFLASQLCRSVGLHRSTSACLIFTYPLLMLCMAWFSTQMRSFGLSGLVWSFIAANGIGLVLLSALYWRYVHHVAPVVHKAT